MDRNRQKGQSKEAAAVAGVTKEMSAAAAAIKRSNPDFLSRAAEEELGILVVGLCPGSVARSRRL